MQKYILMRKVVWMVVLGLSVLMGLSSSAEAVIIVRSAAVVNGVAVVEGGNAARAAPISWEGTLVTQANNGGNFAFQGVVPADCVGSLHEGDPAAAITVALANCGPVSGAPAPVPQTGQTQCWDHTGTLIPCDGTGHDGDIQAGVAWPTPRFTDHGNGTVTDHLTGLIWLQDANCFGEQLWPSALTAAIILASPNCGLSDGSVAGDWRLPNVRELLSLISFNHIDPTLPSDHPFSGVPKSGAQSQPFYWSSTTYPAFPWKHAWIVSLYEGFTSAHQKDSHTRLVWPVRGPE